jgi:hypothetical protein
MPMLFFEHHAKIIAIYAMESLQYYSTLIFVNYIINSTHFLLDNVCFDNLTA